jgi:hypothetical protein
VILDVFAQHSADVMYTDQTYAIVQALQLHSDSRDCSFVRLMLITLTWV